MVLGSCHPARSYEFGRGTGSAGARTCLIVRHGLPLRPRTWRKAPVTRTFQGAPIKFKSKPVQVELAVESCQWQASREVTVIEG